jgi:hypothetical protein
MSDCLKVRIQDAPMQEPCSGVPRDYGRFAQALVRFNNDLENDEQNRNVVFPPLTRAVTISIMMTLRGFRTY